MVPLTFLTVVGGIIFPGWLAFVYVLGGALLGSAIGFIGGRVMSRGALERISGSRLGQLSRQSAKRGTIAVAVLRLVPIAPFAVFNLVAGASHLGLRQFMVGSLLGLAPVWARSPSSRAPTGRRSASRPRKTWPSRRRRGSG